MANIATMNNEQNCPLSDSGYHRYFIFKTLEVFEPRTDLSGGPTLYEKKEYAHLGCNCGSVIKRQVAQA